MSLKINGKENEFQMFFSTRKSKKSNWHGSSHGGTILYAMVDAVFFLTYSHIVLDKTEI